MNEKSTVSSSMLSSSAQLLDVCCVVCVDVFMFFAFQVNGKTLKFKRAVVATGGSAALPPIPGLKESPYLTNASIFNLTVLPRRMVSVVQTLLQEPSTAVERYLHKRTCCCFFVWWSV